MTVMGLPGTDKCVIGDADNQYNTEESTTPSK